jgi:hypothetical protein
MPPQYQGCFLYSVFRELFSFLCVKQQDHNVMCVPVSRDNIKNICSFTQNFLVWVHTVVHGHRAAVYLQSPLDVNLLFMSVAVDYVGSIDTR